MEYCDLIASLIKSGLEGKMAKIQTVAFFGIETKLDLDPDGGFLLSTDKVISCRDNKGNKYKITVQAQPVASMEQTLESLNLKHSNNGDVLAHYLDAITTKLIFAQQDRSVLADISEAELEVLQVEINNVREAQEKKIGSF